MKVSSYLLVLSAFFRSVRSNPTGCVNPSSVTETTDLFPDNVSPEESQQWSVEYTGTYKVLTNKAAGETYLLYQCGTEVPLSDVSGFDAVFSIPVVYVGVASTPMIPFIELLGKRESITAFFGSASWVSSPCLSQLFDEGKVTEVMDPNNETAISVPLDLPAFISDSSEVVFENAVRFSESEEQENLAVFEWLKVYSLFYNKEAEANEIFDAVKERYVCGEQNADLLSCDVEAKPIVLWGSYSDYCGGWSVAKCPNYYCEFAEACDSELLFDNTGGSYFSEVCGTNYMTTEEFFAFGKDAEYWIYTSPDFTNALAEFEELNDFVSVKNQQVFDTEGSGGSAWFEQRIAEPDVVLQDFCQIVGYENPSAGVPHTRAWLRNVFTEAVGSLGQCTDTSAPLETRATECDPIPSDFCDATSPPDSGAENPTLLFVAAFTLSAMLGSL